MRFWRRLLNALRPGAPEADLAREIDAHLGLIEDDLRRRGVPAPEAHRRARVMLGGVEQAKERHRAARSFAWIDDLRRDVRHSARLLRRNPIFALTAALSLAIAIGAVTTVFTAADALLLRSAPGVARPEQLVDINRTTGEIGVEAISYRQYLDIRERTTRVEQVYAYGLSLTPMSLAEDDPGAGAQAVFAAVVTPNFFAALGVLAAEGRVFGEHDSARVVVLSDRFWQRRFSRDRAVIGAALRLGDQSFSVVGVARPEFHGNTVLAPDLWVPVTPEQPMNTGLVGARLKRGVSMAEAAAEIATIGAAPPEDLPRPGAGRRPGLSLSRSSPVPSGVRILVAGFLGLLMAIVTLVLVVACANVAGILLARAAARRRETAIRLAIGVGRARLVRQLLTEAIVLFALGGVAGLALSRAMNAAILRVLPAFPMPADVALTQGVRAAAFSMAVALAAAIVFGLAPALEASRVDVVSILKAHDQGPAGSLRLRRAFVIAQIAGSVVLVIVGSLLARALTRAGSLEQGFDPHGVEVASIDLSLAGYGPGNGPAFCAELQDRVNRLPDVQSAALAFASPAAGLMGFQVDVPGVRESEQAVREAVGNIISPRYFATLRVPLIAGRDFTDRDGAGSPPVTIVTASTVTRFWPEARPQDAIGRQVVVASMVIEDGRRRRPAGTPFTVVGVAADVGAKTARSTRPFLYLPLAQRYFPSLSILVRTADGRRPTSDVRAVLTGMDRRLPILSATTLEEQGGPAITQLRITAAISATLGTVAFLLAAIGVYGITAYMVTRRTREIGIRVALGADRIAVVRMVLAETARLVAVGGAIGLAFAAAATRLLDSMLFGIPPYDPLTFGGVPALFAAVALAASCVPLRRALRVNPTEALRYE